MKMSEFKYNLPKERIAQYPPIERGTTNLLVLDKGSGEIVSRKYFNIPEYIQKGDIIVLNETKVINSRTFFTTPKGKRVEVLFLENLNGDTWFVLVGRAKDVKCSYILAHEESNSIKIAIKERKDNGFIIDFKKGSSKKLFEKYGHTPLPPYMHRQDEESDKKRYNTVFSKVDGAVAAPTASLNLTEDMLQKIKKKGADIAKIELRVGWGTFAPVREEDIESHKIHEEYMVIDEKEVNLINEAISNGNRVWAFGTTVARALETAFMFDDRSGKYLVKPFSGETDLFIYPGYRWKIVNVLVTNFHMPNSSLILLVSSFAGKERIEDAYQYAIENDYKFLSYGDSMLIGENL